MQASLLMSIMASKSKIENEIKGHQPQRHIYTPLGMCVCNMKTMQQMLSEISQKADLHPLGDVFMQDESKPVCVLKTKNTDARIQPDMLTTISWAGDKK